MKENLETRIALQEQQTKTIMDKLDNIIERFEKFEEKLDRALDKKADKWVETAVSWAGYTIVGAVLLALVYLVIK